MAEQETLYKLMILYMLKKVNFPLSNAQLWTFFDERGYTAYFDLQKTVNELLESNLISRGEVRSTVRFEITKEGEQALYYFKNDINETVLSDMDEFLKNNKFQLRNETGVVADYQKTENYDYMTTMSVKEGQTILFEMKITVPTEEQAKILCDHFMDSAQTVYASVLNQLM